LDGLEQDLNHSTWTQNILELAPTLATHSLPTRLRCSLANLHHSRLFNNLYWGHTKL